MPQGSGDPAEKQARNHKPALIAIAVALLVAVLAFVFFGATDPAEITDSPTAGAESAPEAGSDAESVQ